MAKILLVEDDPFLTNMYKTRFAGEKHEVMIAADGESAIAFLKQTPPHVVVLDVMMPKMGGFSVLEHMRGNPQLQTIPVIVLSNLTDPQSIKKAKELGAKEFLVKAQNTPTQVFEVIKKYLPS